MGDIFYLEFAYTAKYVYETQHFLKFYKCDVPNLYLKSFALYFDKINPGTLAVVITYWDFTLFV